MTESPPIWQRRVRVPVLLWVGCTILVLVWLNRVTAGVSQTHRWSLFGIWAGEWRYLAASAEPWREALYLLHGRHSKWLWTYTLLHLLVAAILGWSVAAAGAAIAALARDRLHGLKARAPRDTIEPGSGR